MLRSHDQDTENVAPSSTVSSSTQRAQKPFGLSRQTLGPRKQVSTKPRLSNHIPFSERSVNQENSLPSKGTGNASSKQQQQQRPKRRALGDITNKGASASAISQPKGLGGVPKSRSKESHVPIPRDEFGRVEEPDLCPQPLPRVYEPPEIEFTEQELDAIRPKDDGCDLFGRPKGQLMFHFPAFQTELPPPAETGTGLEQELGQILETEKEQIDWNKGEWSAIDELELELP